jgi:hypothetical protein
VAVLHFHAYDTFCAKENNFGRVVEIADIVIVVDEGDFDWKRIKRGFRMLWIKTPKSNWTVFG